MAIGIQCALCEQQFSVSQLSQLALSTMVCGACYKTMQQQPISVSCFGKISVYRFMEGKPVQVQRGFHPQAAECNEWCPDRRICKAVLYGKEL